MRAPVSSLRMGSSVPSVTFSHRLRFLSLQTPVVTLDAMCFTEPRKKDVRRNVLSTALQQLRSHNDRGSGNGHVEPFPVSLAEASVVFLALLALGLVVYYAGFHAPMIYDSLLLKEKEHVLSHPEILKALALVPDRPLFVLSCYLNYHLGGLDPFYYRLVNMLFLAATGLVMVILVRLVLVTQDEVIGGTLLQKRVMSIFAGLAFVLHPTQILVVLYIWQRQALMLCFFYFSAMTVYFAVRMGHVRARGAGYALVSILMLCGLLCKENIITLPAVLILAELTLLVRYGDRLVRRIFIISAIGLFPVVAAMAIRHVLHSGESLHAKGTLEALQTFYSWSGLGLSQVLLTQCRVFGQYFSMIVAPFHFDVVLVEPYVVSTSLFEPPSTLPAVMMVVALLGLSIGLIRRNPVCSFSVLFALGVLVPEALCVPHLLFFGYRAILPMLGAIVGLSAALLYLWVRMEKKEVRVPLKAVIPALLCGLLVSLGVTSHDMAKKWEPLRFWQDAFERLPPYSRKVELTPYLHVLGNYGTVLLERGRNTEGIRSLRRAVEIAPRRSASYADLGVALQMIGKTDEAIVSLRKAIELDPSAAANYDRLAVALLEKHRIPEASELLRKSIELDPKRPSAYVNLGNALLAQGNAEAAVSAYHKAVQLAPDIVQPYLNLGAALNRLGRLDQARMALQRAIFLNPRHAKAHANLGNVLLAMRNVGEALPHLQMAVDTDPQLVGTRRQLARAFAATGRFQEAAGQYAKVLDSEPNAIQTQFEFAHVLLELGNPDEAITYLTAVLRQNPEYAGAQQSLAHAIDRAPDCQTAKDRVLRALELDKAATGANGRLLKMLREACPSREEK